MSTQLQYARLGEITEVMQMVADAEEVEQQWLINEVAAGRCVIPFNKNRNKKCKLVAIGNGLSTKINANIGTSPMHCDVEEELDKLHTAINYGADAVMDLSTGGNIRAIRRKILSESDVIVGTVPIYAVEIDLERKGKDISCMDPEALFAEIEEQAADGVDFMTLHCAVTKRSLSFLRQNARKTGIVSRGGALLYRYIENTGKDNPLYEQFDRILDICYRHDVTISLGDGLRPGCASDASDSAQIAEVLVQGELVERARAKGVQVMVEGPGHMPVDQIAFNIQLIKHICRGAPLYVLGPLVTDAAAGYDHIAGAIGGTIAAASGADFLCYLTPAEHVSLPDADDVREGVIASRIAAHAADVAKRIPRAIHRNNLVSDARFKLNWEEMFSSLLEPGKARYKKSLQNTGSEEFCTMCGQLCAMKIYRETK